RQYARRQPLPLRATDVQAEDQGSMSCDQARAEQVEGLDPRLLHERRLLRKPRLRDRGRRADVLLATRTDADAGSVGPARGAATGALGLRPYPPAPRCARAARRGLTRDAREWSADPAPVRLGDRGPRPPSRSRRALHANPRAVLLQFRP